MAPPRSLPGLIGATFPAPSASFLRMALPMDASVSGRDVILEVRRNMRRHGEELLYSTIVPARYEVYLHVSDFERLEGLVPRIVEEARRALSEELARLNRGSNLTDRLRDALGRPRAPRERTEPDWRIEIAPDPDDEAVPGDIRVFSTFVLPGQGSYGGHETRRVFTSTRRPAGEVVEVPEPTRAGASAGTVRPLASLHYEDDNGPQTFRMVQPRVVIGRGGAGYWVDLKLRTLPDVSRDHCRIRFDPAKRAFWIRDHSSFGTTVDGARLPASPEGRERGELEGEVALPPKAVIGLADVVSLRFEAEA